MVECLELTAGEPRAPREAGVRSGLDSSVHCLGWLAENRGLFYGALDRSYFFEGRGLPLSERNRVRREDYPVLTLMSLLTLEDMDTVGRYFGSCTPKEYHEYKTEQQEVWMGDERCFLRQELGREPTGDEVFEKFVADGGTIRFRLCWNLLHPDKVVISRPYCLIPKQDRIKLAAFYQLAELILGVDYEIRLGINHNPIDPQLEEEAKEILEKQRREAEMKAQLGSTKVMAVA